MILFQEMYSFIRVRFIKKFFLYLSLFVCVCLHKLCFDVKDVQIDK